MLYSFFFGDYSASGFYAQPFRHTLSVPSSQVVLSRKINGTWLLFAFHSPCLYSNTHPPPLPFFPIFSDNFEPKQLGKGKGKVHPRTGHDGPGVGGVEVYLYSFSNLGARWPIPCRFPPGNTRYPLYRRLGGAQGRSGRVRKMSPPPGFDPRTVQPVASRYTDWPLPALNKTVYLHKCLSNLAPVILPTCTTHEEAPDRRLRYVDT